MVSLLAPLPFVCLFITSCFATTLMLGGSWLLATAATLFVLSFCMIVGIATWLMREYYHDRRVWVLDEPELQDPPTTISVRGVPAVTSEHIVVGMPVHLNTQNTVRVVLNFPQEIVGRPLNHDLRAAGFA